MSGGRFRNQRGVTLVELLVAAVVGSIIILALGGFFVSTARFGRENDAQAYLQRQATLIIDQITSVTRTASDVTVDTCNDVDDALVVSGPDPDSPGDFIFNCFYVTPSGQFVRYREKTVDASSGTRDLLSSSLVSLRVVSLTRSPDALLFLDLCGTPSAEGTYSPPYLTCQTTAEMAYVTFKLEAPNEGGMNMTFTAAIGRRNIGDPS